MSDTPRHSVSVAAAIFDDSGENVLLIKRRDNGRWEPPGGVLEIDETIEDGLRREVREETGAEIDVGALTGVYKNMSRGIIALVFRCTAKNEPSSDTTEAAEISWHSIGKLKELMPEAYRVRLEDARHGAVSVRSHDGTLVLPLTPADP
jgi:ADP-ribose pyrophosphatase YjhB (NUDIX family)